MLSVLCFLRAGGVWATVWPDYGISINYIGAIRFPLHDGASFQLHEVFWMLRTMLPAAIAKARSESIRWVSAISLVLVLVLGFWPLPAMARSHRHAHRVQRHRVTSHRGAHRRYRRHHRRVRRARYRRHWRHSRRVRGQRAISHERTLEIQRALIRQHYLASGQDTGLWDQATRKALIRFQGDNHWQTKILPDSRALIKLGLGPSRDNLLNPESAAIGMPGWPSLAGPGQPNTFGQGIAN